MKQVEPGTRYLHRVLPGAQETAAAVGNDGVLVVSSPSLILYCEKTAFLAIAPFFDEGEASVGTGFRLDHTGAAKFGEIIEIEAEVIAQEGRRVTFKCRALQQGRLIMEGEHSRIVVRLKEFLVKIGVETLKPKELELWFDFHSPWSFLALERVGPLAKRLNLALRLRPVHLPRLIERIDGRRPLEENAAFLSWYRQDLIDQAALLGLKLSYHPRYPLRPARALRAALYAIHEGRGLSFARRVAKAYWTKEGDIEDVAALAAWGEKSGLDGKGLLAAIESAAIKAELEANLEEAIAAGIFGVPTAVISGKRYFGQDRLDLLERHVIEGVV